MSEVMLPAKVAEIQVRKPRNAVEGVMIKYAADLFAALGNRVDIEQFMAAVNGDVLRNPKLLEAARSAPHSLLECLLLAANAKLMPGAAYDQLFLIPRKIRGRMEVTALVGYKGLCDMAQRHERVHAIEAFLVYEGDAFEYDQGTGHLSHRWSWSTNRSDANILGGYAKVTITAPNSTRPVDKPIVWAMTREEIDACRARSQAYVWAEKGRKDSPWHTDYAAMARKTLMRAILQKGSVPRQLDIAPLLLKEHELESTTYTAEVEDVEPVESRADAIAAAIGAPTSKDSDDDGNTPREVRDDQ